MPKVKISEYSTTNSSNSDIEGINIAEGCAPSGINNAIRELMVHLKEFQTGSSGDPLTVGGNFVVSGTSTLGTVNASTINVNGVNILNIVYPVGSIYVNATNSTNPGTLLGFGTWTAFGAGRVMVGFNASDSLFDTAEETGGSKDAIVVSHTHTATSTVTDPGHTHSYSSTGTLTASAGAGAGQQSGTTGSSTTGITVSTSISTEGSSGTNANLQPYITVYMWKRTA